MGWLQRRPDYVKIVHDRITKLELKEQLRIQNNYFRLVEDRMGREDVAVFTPFV